MPRFFNTAGPCEPQLHFMLPPEERLPELERLVARQQYFVLHAPRQTGKTTVIQAWTESLRRRGVVAMVASLETSYGLEDPDEAVRDWMAAITQDAWVLEPEERPPSPGSYLELPATTRLRAWLSDWCVAVGRPVVLVLDEADLVAGPAMISLLRQLRAGYPTRTQRRFPMCVGLIGMRDLRDDLMAAKDGQPVNKGSPFNVKAESLTLADFTAAEVRELMAQHTADTGQGWSSGALERLFERTQGQPYLVNAVADQVTTFLVTDRSLTIDETAIDAAIQRLILKRVTHLDNLAERLKEGRVVRVIEAVLLGDEAAEIDANSDDLLYTRDLGLVRVGAEGVEVANPIYREVLVRQLAYNHQLSLPAPWWPWRTAEGRLNVPELVAAFLQWWRENADILRNDKRTPYRESAAHLAFMGFLQRVVNGGGTVEREYAAARGRVDIVVRYGGERHVFELKRVTARRSREQVVLEGTRQLGGYLDGLGIEEGWLIVFDARAGGTWEERLWAEDVQVGGRLLHLRGA